jgi:hypothetical protein
LNVIAGETIRPGASQTTMTVPAPNNVDALLDHFPGPLRISVSIPRYLTLLALVGAIFAMGIFFISHPEKIAAALATSHGEVRGAGFLHLLVLLHAARDISQAVAELGWFAVIVLSFGVLGIVRKLIFCATGKWGLLLDTKGFVVLAPKRNTYHRWLDVGDFDSVELPRRIRRGHRWPLSTRYVVFNDYEAPKSPLAWLQRTGHNRALLESYAYSANDLALAMSVWRERALEEQARQIADLQRTR